MGCMALKGQIMRFYKNKKSMEKSVYLSCALGVIAVIIRTVLLLFYFDKETGLPIDNSFTLFLNLAVYGLIAIIVVINLQLAMDIAPITGRFKLSMPPIAGYSLFLTAIAFLIQGVVSFLRDLFKFLEWNALDIAVKEKIAAMTVYFPLVIDIFAVLSAVAFYLAAMEHFRDDGDGFKPTKSFIIPVLWCALLVLELVINALNVITVQNIMEKTILYLLVLLFVYYAAMWGYGLEPKRKSVFSIFIRAVFPVISLTLTLPYAIAYLFGVRDTTSLTPLIALIGLSTYGFIILLQYLVASVYFVSKTKYRS